MSARKFSPPAVSEYWLRRDRLFGLLNKAVKQGIAFIHAPGGCGKTVLAAGWLATKRKQTAWLALDRYDNEPAHFYAGILGAMAQAQKGNRALLRYAGQTLTASDPLTYFLKAMSAQSGSGKGSCLVVDDFQNIDNPDILAAIPRVLAYLPADMFLVIASRREAPEPFDQLIAKGQITFLSAAELRFSPDEAYALSEHKGLDISFIEAEHLCRSVGGWALGVQARLHEYAPGAAPLEMPRSGSDGQNAFTRYLERQIWAEMDASLRDMLLKTAFMQELEPDVCAYMTGCDDCAGMLERLRKESAFIVGMGEGRYRLHDMFRDWLLAKWQSGELAPERPGVVRKTAEWFRRKEKFFQAIDLYLEAADLEGVGEVMRDMSRYDTEHLPVERHIALVQALERRNLPEAFLDSGIEILSHFAWAHFLAGDAEGFCSYADRLKAKLDAMPELAPDQMENYALVFSLDFRVPILDYAAALAEQAAAMRERPDAVDASACANSLTQNLPLPHRSMRDYSVLVLAGKKGYDVLRASFGLLIRQDYDILEHCFRAGLHFERGETGAALSALRAVGDSAKRNPNPELHLGVESLWYLLLTRMEEHSEAEKIADGLARWLEAADAAFLWPNFLAFVYESRMRRGQRIAAREWLDNYAAPLQLFYCRFPQHFTTARALIHSDSCTAAIRLLDRLRIMADSYQRPLDVIEADILLCQAYWRLGERAPAIEALDRAVTLAQLYGFTRLFAQDAGVLEPVVRLLAHRHENNATDRHFIKQLLPHVGDTAQAPVELGELSAKVPGLTGRQADLLALLAKGHGTMRIAADLGVTPNTVRNHFQRLFLTLGVKNRQEALRVARGLRLV